MNAAGLRSRDAGRRTAWYRAWMHRVTFDESHEGQANFTARTARWEKNTRILVRCLSWSFTTCSYVFHFYQELTSRKECCRYLAQKALSRHLAAGKATLPIPWNTLATALANMGTSCFFCNKNENGAERSFFASSVLRQLWIMYKGKGAAPCKIVPDDVYATRNNEQKIASQLRARPRQSVPLL